MSSSQIDYGILRNEILTDPSGYGYSSYVTAGNDVGVANLLNITHSGISTYIQFAPLSSVLVWGANGPIQQISDYCTNPSGAAPLRAICIAAMKMFDAAIPVLNMGDPNVVGSIQTLENNHVISSGSTASIMTLAYRSPASRAEALFGADININSNDVSKALRGV